MNTGTKREIIIKCASNEDKKALGNSIHEQLRGNPDYIDSRIVLNIDTDKVVNLVIFADAKPVDIVIRDRGARERFDRDQNTVKASHDVNNITLL